MKILAVKQLVIPEIKVVRFARFGDHRGYFTETFRKSDFLNHNDLPLFNQFEFSQCNESYSEKGVLRGLHFQWNPFMGKLVRTIYGHMVDLVLDIRKESPTFGKILAYDMPAEPRNDFSQWIWVPPGFAHGNFFLQETVIEYFCTGEYSPGCEAGISPCAEDIDWGLCDDFLKRQFDKLLKNEVLISDKDRAGFSLSQWISDERSENFLYKEL
ncbi:dTDP-4-dehydrorhamnose 3,5-epimerase family protein [Chlamydiota bacterium]